MSCSAIRARGGRSIAGWTSPSGRGSASASSAPSGCGKSSIVRLLLRFFDPEEGRVLLGGLDLRETSFARIRQRVAVVNQDTFLFHGTVGENIRMGRPDASDAEVAEAARAANIHGFVETLPQGYDTIVGEKGIKLSGGQRQRVAIARALLRDAPILVLDEALSAVDAENEAVIQEALDRLMRGRTTLVLAHRLSSVIGCDRILALDGGLVAEAGTHAELLAAGGVYARLMREQAREAEAPDGPLGAAPARPGRAGEGAAAAPALAAADAAGEGLPQPPTEGVIAAEGLNWGPGRRRADAGGPALEGPAGDDLPVRRRARARLHRRRRGERADRAGLEGTASPTTTCWSGCGRWPRSPASCTGSNPGWRTTWPSACWRRCGWTPSASSTRSRPPISRAGAPAT